MYHNAREARLGGGARPLQREELEEGGGGHGAGRGGAARLLHPGPELGALVRDAGVAERAPEQAAAVAAQRQHLGVLALLAQPERPAERQIPT